MQDHGLGQMLQILQSPMGAALIPQMNQRENLVIDRGNADLQAVIQNTVNSRQEAQRRQEMHPLEMETRKISNQGQGLVNRTRQNDLDLFDKRGGVDGAAKRADDEDAYNVRKKDFEIFERGLKTFRESAAIVTATPVGQKRAVAVEMFRRAQMPDAVIKRLETLPEDQIDNELATSVRNMNEFAPKFALETLKGETSLGVAGIKAGSAEKVAELKGKYSVLVAQIRAASKKVGSGTGADPNMSKWYAGMAQKIEGAIARGDEEQVVALRNQVEEMAKLIATKPSKPPAGVTEEVIERPDGRGGFEPVFRTRKGPAQTQQAPSTDDGWGPVKAR